jgi:phosphocarrier protein
LLKEEIIVKNKLGLHARPAALLAAEAGRFKSDIFITKDNMEVNAKSIMGLMMIAAECGSKIILTITGEDEAAAHAAMRGAFARIFEDI